MAFRQTQTAFTAREYAQHGINLLHSPVPVLGPPWDIPFEFPLFQALAAVVGTFGLDPVVAVRLSGLICFQLTCGLLGLLARQWFSTATGLIAMTIFQVTPFGIQWGWASLIEFAATAGSVGALVATNAWARRPSPVLLGFAVLGQTLAFLIKPTTALPWLILYLVPILRASSSVTQTPLTRVATYIRVLAAPAIGGAAGACWTIYADGVKKANHYSEFLTSHNLLGWNFGSLAQRRLLGNWGLIDSHLAPIIGGATWLSLLACLTFFCWPRARLPAIGLALVPVLAIVTFFNLYFVHDYYLCAVYPALVLLAATALCGVAHKFPTPWIGTVIGAVLGIGLMVLTWGSAEGQRYLENVREQSPVPILSQEISAKTPASARIIVVGCDWDPTYLYYANRRGLMLRAAEKDPRIAARLIPRRYSYVAFCGVREPDMGFLPPDTRIRRVAPHLFAIR